MPILTPEQILLGERLEPIEYIKSYHDKKFEMFILEWAYLYLQEISGEYEQVGRFGGAGDMGRDIIAYLPLTDGDTDRSFDIYQCKHYDHPLQPNELWPELVKLCYFTWKKEFRVPRRYRFMAPRDLGPTAGKLLEKPEEIRKGLKEKWSAASEGIVAPVEQTLLGELLAYVDAFDFSIVGSKPMHEVIEEFRKTHRFAPRFGGGLTKPLPPDPIPPEKIAEIEQTYTKELILAYGDHLQDPGFALVDLPSQTHLHGHFSRCRERFYCAEVLREFSKNLPDAADFETVQDQVHDQVIDVVMSPHKDGYARIVAATTVAGSVSITNHPLRSYIKSKSLHGICHQLVNNKRFRWILDGQ